MSNVAVMEADIPRRKLLASGGKRVGGLNISLNSQ